MSGVVFYSPSPPFVILIISPAWSHPPWGRSLSFWWNYFVGGVLSHLQPFGLLFICWGGVLPPPSCGVCLPSFLVLFSPKGFLLALKTPLFLRGISLPPITQAPSLSSPLVSPAPLWKYISPGYPKGAPPVWQHPPCGDPNSGSQGGQTRFRIFLSNAQLIPGKGITWAKKPCRLWVSPFFCPTNPL